MQRLEDKSCGLRAPGLCAQCNFVATEYHRDAILAREPAMARWPSRSRFVTPAAHTTLYYTYGAVEPSVMTLPYNKKCVVTPHMQV